MVMDEIRNEPVLVRFTDVSVVCKSLELTKF